MWFDACSIGEFDGQFHRLQANRTFFHIGAGVHVTLFEGSEATVWGDLGSHLAQLEYVDPPRGRGSGAPEDPFEVESSFAVGDPTSLVVRQVAEWTNRSNEVLLKWDVHNVSVEPVRFRLTVLGDQWGQQCGYGDAIDGGFGSYSPETGVPELTQGCEGSAWDQGQATYALERGDNPWTGFQQGDPVEVQMRIADGVNLANTVERDPGRSAIAAEWDQYGPATGGLAAGATAHFSMGWRFTSDLVVKPWDAFSKKAPVRLKLLTKWGLEGPQAGRRIAYRMSNPNLPGYIRGAVETNAKGAAYLVVRERKRDSSESIRLFFDTNGDGRWQERSELVRERVTVDFHDLSAPVRFGTRATLLQEGETFHGRVRAVKRRRVEYLEGVDCRSHRSVAIRRVEPGRDVTLATAVTNGKGVWDLDLDAGASRYYGVVLAEERLSDDDFVYTCKGTTMQ